MLIPFLSFRTPEVLSQPSMLGPEAHGVHKIVYVWYSSVSPANINRPRGFDSIMRCDTDIRHDLYQNDVLSGGTTKFPGFADRIYKELITLAPSDIKVIFNLALFPVVLKHTVYQVHIVAPNGREYCARIGGWAIVTSLSIPESLVHQAGV